MNKKLLLLSVLILAGCGDVSPSLSPTVDQTIEPSIIPTQKPTVEPTIEPSIEPTVESTLVPSEPTVEPTIEPTVEPTVELTPIPSEPTAEPTIEPTVEPTIEPSTDNIIDVSEKEYYKSLVNRENIIYSNDFKNDPMHDVTSLEIFQLNDTHGAYLDGEDITGISRVATTIKNNIIDPYSVVKIANGDMLQGTAFSNMLLGEPCIASLNEMNFDAFVIGNHEFDWSLDNLSVYKDGDLSNGELECDFLGANIVNSKGERPDWIKPYTLVEKGNVKVGIIGVIGDNLESSISKVALGDYQFSSSVEAVNKYSKILIEEEKANIIIVSSHSHDNFGNQSFVKNSEVDAIINGHDHNSVEETVVRYDGKEIPVIESYTKNYNIGKITLNLDKNKDMQSFKMKHFDPEYFSEDENLKNIMDEYNKVTAAYQNEVIGYKAGGFNKKDLAISTCTYIAEKYDADIAMMNTGGVRANILQSEITNALVYEALPFDNELYIATVNGKELYQLVSKSGNYFNQSGIGNGTNCVLSKIEDDKMYKIVCVDYVATKTFYANYFNEEHDLIKTGDYIRDCAIENIKQNYKK